jgi:DNA helicase-2/ATP-dependent DNA helicase PcrA
MFKPRPKQAEVLKYRSGKMGVSAVPGSGKTATLSYLAAELVASGNLQNDQEVLIVTLVRSAVGNFAGSLAKHLKNEHGLLPNFGYRVRTLHGLANDIVRERPALAGLSDGFTVLDERTSNDILDDAVNMWIKSNAHLTDHFLHENIREEQRDSKLREAVKSMAVSFIHQAKDMQLTVSRVSALLHTYDTELFFAQICTEIYRQYEHSLQYRGAVDFQDLVRLALHVLKQDKQYLERLRYQFPYILEDEAQDSSKLQEDILRLLVGKSGNWVRVGDSNQAIYDTFTTANPKYLRDFLNEGDVANRTLPNSGRSNQSIINLANQLIKWSLNHPHQDIRNNQPLTPPFIEPTPEGDPQGNPPNTPNAIYFSSEKHNEYGERQFIMNSLQNWLPDNPDMTCAILVATNKNGADFVLDLRKKNIPYVENLRSSNNTRAVVGTLTRVLDYLVEPDNSRLLSVLYRVWRRDSRGIEEQEQSIEEIVKILNTLKRTEDYLNPRTSDWLSEQPSSEHINELKSFRQSVTRWQNMVDLPIDQIILTIGGDIFQVDTEIAICYSVALYLQQFAEYSPQANLRDFAIELREIAKGNRQFSSASDEYESFDPEQYKGKVTVTTMHKAKGLEWDRVYITGASNYGFPSLSEFDNFIGEKWFVRDNLNIAAEALAQLHTLANQTPYVEGKATMESRIEYVSERLRLLYVGITRAKRELIVTWNNGYKGNNVEALPVAALRGWWEERKE